MRKITAMAFTALASACTQVDVKPLDSTLGLHHICIEENPKVIVGDFLPVLTKGVERHGITTEVYSGEKPSHCRFSTQYTAYKTWDMAMYMHHAELSLYDGRQRVGYAEYHLTGKGGFALNKWASVESKMAPVIDELFANYSPDIVAAARKSNPIGEESTIDENYDRLQILRTWFEEGLITETEYQREKSQILDET